ncbi:MAG: asparaginyl-tRNA synthetase [Chaenotheca gracillima]|nr:MAG: asparaginyl-tRNA synthetase [Chaenotheca gracillima]
MTTRIDLGFPKLLPIIGTWSLPFAAYYALLTNRIVYHRLAQQKYLGDNSTNSGATNHEEPEPLYLATRGQANFLENVPLALVFAGIAELNGGSRKVLNYGLAALFFFRVAHVELGLNRKGTMGVGRVVGYYGSQGFLVAVASYSAYLVKGYWGF